MIAECGKIRRTNGGLCALALLVLASSLGCTFHRNLLLRWHIEFAADSIADDEVPCSVDEHCRCDKCSRLGRPPREAVPAPTPAQTGHARFHPVPSKPVFPEPDGSDMADMGPPAPQNILREREPLNSPGRIEAEQSVPLPEDVEKPLPFLPNDGWDVNNS